MTKIESAWSTHPEYLIELLPVETAVRVRHGDLLLVETDACVRLTETEHFDRLYVPVSDVRWEHFTATDLHTVCPFKGEASYWSLTAVEPPVENVLWHYTEPFEEVAELEGYVGIYHERLLVESDEPWNGDAPGYIRPRRFPAWGSAHELQDLMDVEPAGANRFTGPARPLFVPKWGEAPVARNVVEGGQLLGQAITAAAKTLPSQQVTHASMVFTRSASFDAPIDLEVDVLRKGRSFSTVEARSLQQNRLCATATLLMDSGTDDLMHHDAPMPSVGGPSAAERLDMGVVGRELRVVDGAYSHGPSQLGPPTIQVWCRFAEAPPSQPLQQAMLAQSMTHWTIAAAMRPHVGIGEVDAHLTLSTGIMAVTVAFHDDVDVSQWLLYDNISPHAGRGLAHGDGKVFAEDGRLVASYSVQAMIRKFDRPPADLGHDASTAM